MALEHGDLFFVNRAGATYKIEAVELGDYLTNNPLPGSTEYIVNNGMLSIANQGNANLASPIGIHSANTATDSILDFVDYFVVQRKGTGATVSLNFGTIKEDFLCNTGADSGFDTTNCDCLALDFGYISQKLPCPDGGIVNDNGCMEINYCKDGMLTIAAREGNCLDVKVCTDRGMDISQGCIGLDMDYIVQNITCQDVDSGLQINGSCLSVNFDKVQAKIPLGLIRSSDQSVKFKLGGNQDLKSGDVDLSVDWTKAPFSSGGGQCQGDKLIIKQNNVKKGEYDPCLGSPQIINIDGGGSSGNTPSLCPGGGLTDVNGCLSVEQEEDSCLVVGNLYGSRLTLRREGTGQKPAIVFGVGTSASNDGFYFGIGGDTGDNRLRIVGDKDYIHGNSVDDCGGEPSAGKSEILGLQAPKAAVHVGRGTLKEDIGGGNTPQRFFKSWAIAGDISSGSGKRVFIEAGGYGNNTVKGAQGDSKNYACGGGAGHSPVPGDGGSAPPSLKYEMPAPANGHVSINLDETLINAISEALVGSDTTAATGSNDGLLKFGKISQTYLDQTGLYLDRFLEAPRLYGDIDAIAGIHPSLVRWDYGSDSWTQPDPNVDDWYLKPEQQRTREAIDINEKTILGIALLRGRLQAKRIHDLETSVAALEARLTAAGIP